MSALPNFHTKALADKQAAKAALLDQHKRAEEFLAELDDLLSETESGNRLGRSPGVSCKGEMEQSLREHAKRRISARMAGCSTRPMSKHFAS